MDILLAVLGSSAMASLVSGIFNLITTKKAKDDSLEAGVRILLYDRIKHLSTKYIEQKYVTADALEDLVKMHNVYHNALKGNGFLDDIMAQVKKLPIHYN